MNYGIVDIGSNGIRLKIISSLSRTMDMIYFRRLPISLISSDDIIPLATITSLVLSLQKFQILLASYDSEYSFIIVATESLRRAKNANELIQQVNLKLSVPIKVLTEVEEAYYTSLGILSSVDSGGCKGYVFDLGGGSLEFNYIDSDSLFLTEFKLSQFKDGYSFKLGSKVLKSWVNEDTDNVDINLIKLNIETELESKLPLETYSKDVDVFYWTGGGLRALGYLSMYELNYPIKLIEGYVIATDSLLSVLNKYISMAQKDIDELDVLGLSKQRLTEIKLNCIVATTIINKFKRVKSVRFSTGGITNGILFENLNLKEKLQDPFILTIENYLIGKPKLNEPNFHYLKETLVMLKSTFFQAIDINVIHISLQLCQLFNSKFPVESRANLAFQLFFNNGPFSSTLGITHTTRLLLSFVLATRYDDKDLELQYIECKKWLDKGTFKQCKKLGLLLRLLLAIDPKPHISLDLTKLNIKVLKEGNKIEMVWLDHFGVTKEDKYVLKCIKKLNKNGVDVVFH